MLPMGVNFPKGSLHLADCGMEPMFGAVPRGLVTCFKIHVEYDLIDLVGDPLVVTLRSPSGVKHVFELESSDLVVCIRSVEHTLGTDPLVVYYQLSSIPEGGERPGYLMH